MFNQKTPTMEWFSGFTLDLAALSNDKQSFITCLLMDQT
jgi:hypothetical protein